MIFNHITLIRAEMSRKSKISVSTRHPDFAVVADANNAVAFIRYPGTADEVANVAELLMSDKGAFITGSTFLIDGGATSSYYGPLKPEA